MLPITAWIVAAIVAAGTGGSQSPVPLVPGVQTELPIAEGVRLSFSIPVNAGEGIKAAVDQLGVDVAVELGMGGDAPATADEREKHRYGREVAVWAAPAAGTVVLTVRAQSVMASGGRIRVTVTVYPADDRVAGAIAAFNEARRLPHPSGEALSRAAAAWQSSLAAWRAIGDTEMVAMSLDGLGELQSHDLRTPVDALATHAEAVDLFEALGLKTELYFVLQSLGNAQLTAGQIDRAMDTFQRAYDECGDIDPINRALAARNIVRAAQEIGDLDRAAAFGERAVATLRAADAHLEEMFALDQLAIAYTRMHRNEEALALTERAVALSRSYGSDSDRATVHLVVGRVQASAGDADAALAAYSEALALFRPSDVNRYVTAALAAELYTKRGEPQRARDLLEPIFESAPRQLRDAWAAMANQLGVAFTSQGHADRALPLQLQALEIVVAGQSRTGQLTILRDLATTYRALGDLTASNQMLDRAEKVGGETAGDAYATFLLRERARNARAASDYSTADGYLNRALQIVESERGRLQSDAFRSLYGAATSAFYADVIDTAMRMHGAAPADGHDARAFELFERSRARSLSDLIAERTVIDIRSGVDAALVAEQRDLQRQLGIKDAAVRDLAATPRGRERAATIERDISDIERRLAVVDARIRATNPHYAGLERPQPATLDAAQHLLDEATVLVSIWLGPDASWGWAVTQDTVRPFELPPAAIVNGLARKVYDDLTARRNLARLGRPGHIADIDRDFASHAAALRDAIFGPIAEPLETAWRGRRLAIVATGALQYIPFAALPSPHRAGSQVAADNRLIDRHDLVQLPSMSVLAELRREIVPRRRAGVRVAVLADPVYAADDPRVARTRRSASHRTAGAASVPQTTESLTRGVEDTTRMGFDRLVFSREEAKAISALAAPRVFEALDFDASVRTMKGPQVAAASVIHVASHGIFNSARPQLSGLALSMVDKAGHSTDGVLHLYDILNLRLSADVVVLSGCETGLGRAIEGEGLIGLSRAFMYAGVPRVIASLWEVDDLATAELMRRFYRAVLVDGRRPAAALAVAQRQMRRDPRWRSPYYWAAFTLVGDWR